MTKQKNTKRALLASGLALFMCISMFVGSTFAWFTDSVKTGVNTIQSGTLDIALEYSMDNGVTWENAEGKTLNFKAADNRTDILWEPGCTYELPAIRVRNNGNLALKYNIVINGIDGDAKLFEAIDFTANGNAIAGFSGKLTAKDQASTPIVIKGHMKETAGNEYMGLTIEGIGITVYATQYTYEKDSKDEMYDKNAGWDGTIPATKPDSLVVDTTNKLISINDVEAFAYLNTLIENSSFIANYGSKWKYTIELNTDVNLLGKAWTPILMSNFVAFEGNGHTISNLYVSTDDKAGLFADITCNDIGVTYVRNLVIDGAYVKGKNSVGALAGSSTQGAIENVTINNATVIGNKYVGGVFGWGNGSVNNSTVKNSTVTISENGAKEAGGLIGYLSNDGKASTVNKVIANNLVENVTVVAPSIASALVAQPNSSNKGGAIIVIENNTVKNASITTTADATAAVFVSYNVGDKSLVQNNTEENCKTSVVTASTAGLKDALKAGNETVNLGAGTYTFPSGDFKAGTTLICEEGTVFEGNSKLNINGATVIGATFSNPSGSAVDQTINGVFKDCTFTGSNGLRWCYAGENVVFENCVFSGDLYGAHFDGGANEVLFKNCTLSGFNTFAAKVTKLTFEGCTFKANGRSGYNGANLFGNTEMKDCTFIFDGTAGTEWLHARGTNKTYTFTNCVVFDGTNEISLKDSGFFYDNGTGNTITFN